MGRNKKSNKDIKGHSITIRCTEDEYKHYKKRAERAGMKNLSDYVRIMLSCKSGSPQKYATFLAEAQELMNYVIETYGMDDKNLEKRIGRLWGMIEE